MAAEHVVIMNNEEMAQDKLAKKGCALVDFWASWCGPCRMMAPVIDELAEEYAGKATIGKLNVDDYADIASRHQIVNIPTIILFKDGVSEERLVGVTAKNRLKELLDAYI